MREKDRLGRPGAATPQPRAIIDHEAIEKLKRRAEDIGLIIQHRREKDAAPPAKQKGGQK